MDEHDDFFLDEYDDSKKTSEIDDPRTIRFDTSTSYPEQPKPGKKRHHKRHLFTFVLVVLILLSIFSYFRFFNPYVSEAQISGYITSVEKRGTFFKTFEGDMIGVTALTDTTQHFTSDFVFSIPDENLARQIRSFEGTGRKVTILYKKYYGSLPWRGATPNIAVALQP